MLELIQTPIVVLHVIVCLMLMLVVLIQPGKSGGLGAALGGAGAQQIFGGRGAGNFLTRTTWIGASVFFLTSITLAYISTSTGDSLEDLADVQLIETPPAAAAPAAPAEPAGAAPAAEEPGAAEPAAGQPSPGEAEPPVTGAAVPAEGASPSPVGAAEPSGDPAPSQP